MTLYAAERNPGELGLIARWSREFGYISLHDPNTGEWCDINWKDAPDWSQREAFKRKDLFKSRTGKDKYKLDTREEMEEIWQKERVGMSERPAVTDKGIFYEDYADDDENGGI